MADIELVIKIDAETYNEVCWRGLNLCPRDVGNLVKAIRSGIPLPKGHGRLIDAKQFEIDNKEFWDCDFIHPKYEDTLGELIQDAPTIIEADKESGNNDT